MSNVYPIRAGFSGGVISPASWGRVDTERYRNGLKDCHNFVVTPQGSIKMRRGSRLVGAVNNAALDYRLFPFPIVDGEDVVVFLDGSNLTLYTRNGVLNAGGLYLKDPNLYYGTTFWKNGGSGAYYNFAIDAGKSILMEVGSNQIYAYQQVTAPADTYTLKFSYGTERYFAYNHIRAATSIYVRIGTAPGLGDIYTSPEIWGGTLSAPQEQTVTFTTVGASFYISFYMPWVYRGELSNGGRIFQPILLSSSVTTPQVFASPWTSGQLRDVSIAVDEAIGQMYFVHKNVQPYVLTFNRVTQVWTFAAVVFTAKPASWTGLNWPSVAEIFQSRLWLANTPEKPNALWASKVGAYTNFTVGANPDDAIALELVASGGINFMRGLDNILMGTENGEILLGGDGGEAITGANFFTKRQNGYTSAKLLPCFVGRQIAYVGGSRDKVRVTQQSYEAQGFIGTDISMIASIIMTPRVREVHYAADPEYLFYAIRDDGKIASCTYDAQNDLLAWHTLGMSYDSQNFDRAIIFSGCITRIGDGNALWVVVRRSGRTTLEYIDPDFFIQRYLDMHTPTQVKILASRAGAFSTAFSSAFSGGYDPSAVVKGIDGLSLYEGLIVTTVLETPSDDMFSTDYRVMPDAVVSGGKIFLPPDTPICTAVVGIRFGATAITLPMEEGNPGGTGQGTKRKWNRVFSRVFSSAISLLNGYRPKIAAAQIPPSGNPLDALVTGDYEIHAEGYNDGVVTIHQDLPLRTEISGVFGKAQSNST